MSNHGRFPYNPFLYVKRQRVQQLEQAAGRLLYSYVRRPPNGRGRGGLTFTSFGDMLYDISNKSIYGTNTDEKAVTWDLLVIRLRRDSNRLRVSGGLLQENIDRWGTGDNWGHIIVAFTDGRHGTVGGPNSYTDGTFNDALREIDQYERSLGPIKELPFGWRNEGDATASANTVRTMFAFRAGGFAAFARTWNRVFLGR